MTLNFLQLPFLIEISVINDSSYVQFSLRNVQEILEILIVKLAIIFYRTLVIVGVQSSCHIHQCGKCGVVSECVELACALLFMGYECKTCKKYWLGS
jgi:hypothetical protein